MLLEEIRERWASTGVPTDSAVMRQGTTTISLDDIAQAIPESVNSIPEGSVVAHVGDFTPADIATLLRLIDLGCIIAPLTETTAQLHETFFEVLQAEFIIRSGEVQRRSDFHPQHALIDALRSKQTPGLVLFSSGTTGVQKAALHDFSNMLDKYRRYFRPGLRTLAFLLFDHIGGINTVLHTLFNAGTVHVPNGRRPSAVVKQLAEERISLLPTTPSFLRLALVEGAFNDADLSHLQLVTYGTERMDHATLDRLVDTLPDHVDIRQTYGLTELGIFPVKNRSKNTLWIRVADLDIEVRTEDDVLWIRSPYRMLGYLNAPDPFDTDGWFNTRDRVELDGDYFRILGRTDDVINVGGIKVYPSEIEEVAYTLPEVCFAKAVGEPDPFLGQHIELVVQLVEGISMGKRELRSKLSKLLDREKMPHHFKFEQVPISARFKKA